MRTGDTLLLALAVALYVAMLSLSTWRWRLLLNAQGFPVSLRRLTSSYLVATFFNNFLPSNIGGDVIRVRDSSRLTGSTTTTSLAVVAIDRILGFGALYVLAASAFVLGGRGRRATWRAHAWSCSASFLVFSAPGLRLLPAGQRLAAHGPDRARAASLGDGALRDRAGGRPRVPRASWPRSGSPSGPAWPCRPSSSSTTTRSPTRCASPCPCRPAS